MDKPGQVDILVGWIWMTMGVVSIVLTIAAIGTISLWSFVPIAIGVTQLGRGLKRAAAVRSYSDTADGAKRREADTMLAALVFVSAEQGVVPPDRAARIGDVYQEMLNERPNPERVRELAEKAYDLETLLARQGPLLKPDARMRVVQAARAVASGDDAMEGRQVIVGRLMDAL